MDEMIIEFALENLLDTCGITGSIELSDGSTATYADIRAVAKKHAVPERIGAGSEPGQRRADVA